METTFYNLQPGPLFAYLEESMGTVSQQEKKRKTVISYRNVHRIPPGLLRYANVSAPMSSLRTRSRHPGYTRHDLNRDSKRG